MTMPVDPWSSEDSLPFDLPMPEDGEEMEEDAFRQEEGESTFDRLSSDAFTVPIATRGVTRPLSWSRATPRRPMIASQRLIDRSSLPVLLLGFGAGVLLTSIVAAFIVAGVMGSARGTASAAVITPKSTRALPTVTPTRTPTPTPVPSVAATFGGADTTTQGTWQGVYGGEGAVIIGDTQQLPATIQVAPGGAGEAAWAASTPDPRGLQKLTNPADRVAACWYAPTSFTIDVNITDGQAHRLTLYLVDWDSPSRSETVAVLDPATGASLDTRIAAGFTNGQYLNWTVRGHIVLQITNTAGSPNAVVSGVFFSKA